VSYDIDAGDAVGDLDHFWRSTGFTPATLLGDPDARQAMTQYASVPHDGVRHVRVHYLLDLVRARRLDTRDPAYDWAELDAALDCLVANGLAPVFELMGNPSGFFDDFTDDAQLRAWRRLVGDLATRLVERYGREEVESWYFETWNEPDIGFGWRQFEADSDAFCRYYDACDAGLRDATGSFTLGGPGTAATLTDRTDLFERFLAHCDGGVNELTADPVRLDFVSVHEKGESPTREDVTPDTRGMVDRERRAIDYCREHHPDLADLPFLNNECDPQTGWVDRHTWRARPYYAAVVTKVLAQRVDLVDETGVDYELLSNDNGFLGTWGQRTLCTRFGEGGFHGARETDRNRATEREHYDEFAFVRKPVLNAMTLLSYLGDERVAVDGPGGGAAVDDSRGGDAGVVATRRGDDEVAVLCWHCRDEPGPGEPVTFDLALSGLPFDEAALAHYRVDDACATPFGRWNAQGRPDHPSPAQLAELRAVQELDHDGEPRHLETGDGLSLSVDVPRPGVHLLHLHADPGGEPAPPDGVRVDAYRGLHRPDVVCSWAAPDRRVATYEVLRAEDSDGPFRRINDVDLVATAYTHSPGTFEPDGYYAVRAVDYWGRTGPRSAGVRAG
jgi:L-iduronidase